MKEFVARLIDCGLPREIALKVCWYYYIRHDMHNLQLYVEAVEHECSYDFEQEEKSK